MSEKANVGAGLVVMEDEQMREVIAIQEWSSPVMIQLPVRMTGDEFTEGSIPIREVRDNKLGSIDDPISSLLGSFQSLHNSQSSEKDKRIPYVPHQKRLGCCNLRTPTLTEIDNKKFNLIYESLLLDGKARNLRDLTVGMVLAEKLPAWLQVMHGRLQHLIISSEVFQKKKKAEYDAQGKAKQTGKGKGVGKHSKGIRYLGVSGKEKGKRPHRKVSKSRVTIPI